MMFRTILLSASIALALSFAAANHAQAQHTEEAAFRLMTKIPSDATLRYVDKQERPIPFDDFMAAVNAGGLFHKAVDAATGVITLHLRPFDEVSFREFSRIAPDARMTIYDGDGHVIGFDQFAKAYAGGQSFDKTIDEATGAVNVRLKKFDEAALRSSFAIAPDAPLSFQDAEGRDIGFDRFVEALQSQRLSASKTVNTKTGATVVRLESAEASATVMVPANTDVAKDVVLSPAQLARVHAALASQEADDPRPIFLSFYFAECVPCIAEVPMLNRFAAAASDLRMLAVTFDDAQTVDTFKQTHGFEWPVLSDAQDLLDTLGVKAFPTYALVDANGKLTARSMSAYDGIDGFDEQAVRKWVDSALQTR